MDTAKKIPIVKVSDEVLAVCAASAAIKVDGVADLAGGISDLLTKNLLGKELASRGIRASQSNDTVTIDVNLIVRYGVRIPDLAWDVQEKVKEEVEELTGMHVAAVNINVQGVELPAEEFYDEKTVKGNHDADTLRNGSQRPVR